MIEIVFNTFNFTCILVLLLPLPIFYLLPGWYLRQKKLCKDVFDVLGPVALPIFGTWWLYSWFGGYRFDKIHEMYDDLFAKYGPIIKEEALWNFPVISIREREDIEKVLRSAGKYPLRPPTEVIAYYRKSRPDRFASLGIVNEQGPTWHHLRINLTGELTSTRTIAGFAPQVKEIAQEWCDLIKQQRSKNGEISDLMPLAERLSLEMTCALVLGQRMGFLMSNELSDLAKRLSQAVKQHLIASRDTYYGLPFWKYVITPSYLKLVKAQEEIYSIASELIQSADDYTKESAIFQSVLKAPVDKKEKITVIVDFIAAGIHTLANSLIFLLHLVGSNSEAQEKLKEDLRNGFTTYLKACVCESFRLLPTASCIARILEQDLELSGYHLKAGTVVLNHIGIACKDDRYFENAKQFLPDRWLNSDKTIIHNSNAFLNLPFGVGKRICPGKRFSEQVLTITLETLMEHFRLECKEPLGLVFEFVMSPKAPILMCFKDNLD